MPSQEHFVTAILVSHDGALWLPEVVASLVESPIVHLPVIPFLTAFSPNIPGWTRVYRRHSAEQ